jgi:IS605 OrfB family transposase
MKEIERRAADDESDEIGETENLKEPRWNGTLSTRRRDLEAIRQCLDRGDVTRAAKLKAQLRWTLTVSMEMEGRGPWLRYVVAERASTAFTRTVRKDEPKDKKDPTKGFKRRMGDTNLDATGWPWQEFNTPLKPNQDSTAFVPDRTRERGDKACLLLSRLPGLRVISVDLGHRYAASCAVWESLSAASLKKEIARHAIVAGGTGKDDVFLHTRHADAKTGKDRTTIYRRIGMDALVDGSPHPAPWARLDRQFLIKLQGEENPARAASSKPEHGINEVALVAALGKFIGLIVDGEERSNSRGVDELMRRAVRMATTGLKRHARVAKIAYALSPECPGIPGIGGSLKPITRGDDAHIRFLTDALFEWHSLATDAEWDGSHARMLWNAHVARLPGGFTVDEPVPVDPRMAQPTRQQRRKVDDETREQKLRPIARSIDQAAAKGMHAAWKQLWETADGSRAVVPKTLDGERGPTNTTVRVAASGWHAHLRTLRDWIMGRRLEREQSKRWTRNVGGIGLTRITTMRALYQLHKAFEMRARPERVQGAPNLGDRKPGMAQGILDAMESLREQRVKQIASRIVEAALGVGRHTPAKGKDRDRERPQTRTDSPCHAIVIENLRNYRPDELQTRRENKALMSWSSGKVRKYLEEGCQLHGLHLREVMPNYTSRQCSRTGLPGMRCADVPIKEFLNSRYWAKVVASARKRLDARGTDALDMMIRDLHDHWSDQWPNASDAAKRKLGTLRIPKSGADLFVAAPPTQGGYAGVRRASQADLNAAANIGLRALLDPDFMGKWWYVPCDSVTGKPAKDRCAGAACLALDSALLRKAPRDDTGINGKKRKNGEITNAWRDPSTADPSEGEWMTHAEYWAKVKYRVVRCLREFNGLLASELT